MANAVERMTALRMTMVAVTELVELKEEDGMGV